MKTDPRLRPRLVACVPSPLWVLLVVDNAGQRGRGEVRRRWVRVRVHVCAVGALRARYGPRLGAAQVGDGPLEAARDLRDVILGPRVPILLRCLPATGDVHEDQYHQVRSTVEAVVSLKAPCGAARRGVPPRSASPSQKHCGGRRVGQHAGVPEQEHHHQVRSNVETFL